MVSNVLETYGKNFYGRGKEVHNGRGAKAGASKAGSLWLCPAFPSLLLQQVKGI